jgi:hypothetical protein
MADLTSSNEQMGGKKQFNVLKSDSNTQRNWSNYFPKSGITVYLKYMKDNDLSYIQVGKTLGGDVPDESVEVFAPTTQGTIEAVAYFNEISHNQDTKDNPPPPSQGNDDVASIEDLIRAIMEQMLDGDITFEDVEEQLEKSQDGGQGQGGGEEDGDEEGQGGEPMEGQGGEPQGGGQGGEPQGGGQGGEPQGGGQGGEPQGGGQGGEGQGGEPQGGEPQGGGGGGGTPSNQPVDGGIPVGQANPNDIIEAVESSMNIDRGQLQNILDTKRRVMQRINLYTESELQQIASTANISGSRSEIIGQINQALNTLYNG